MTDVCNRAPCESSAPGPAISWKIHPGACRKVVDPSASRTWPRDYPARTAAQLWQPFAAANFEEMSEEPLKSNVVVSIIVASRGRPDSLERCVASIVECDPPPSEIIVIEQAVPGMRRAWFPPHPALRHVYSDETGKSRALNQAVDLATGDILFFTDDDCTVSPEWIERGVAMLARHSGAEAVFGALEAAPHDFATEWVPVFLPPRERVLHGPNAFMENGGAGANMIISRRALAEAGPFDELLGPGERFKGLEEFDMFYRLLKASMQVVYDPANPVLHWGIRKQSDGSAQIVLRGYAIGEGAVLAKHFRCGDWRALRMLWRATVRDVAIAGRALVRERRPSGMRRLAARTKGFTLGMVAPLDRTHRVFRARRAHTRLERGSVENLK